MRKNIARTLAIVGRYGYDEEHRELPLFEEEVLPVLIQIRYFYV